MQTVTLRLEEDVIESVDTEAEERDLSRSEYIRMLIDRRHEYGRLQDEYDRLQDEYERDLERLQEEKTLLLQQREEHQELVRYVEEETTWREQPIHIRMKWWLLGRGEI